MIDKAHMASTSPTFLSPDETARTTATPQPGEHKMRRRSHGLASILDAGAPGIDINLSHGIAKHLPSASATIIAASKEHIRSSSYKPKFTRRYTMFFGCILLVALFSVNVKMHNKASHNILDENFGTEPLSFLDEAVDACEEAKDEHGIYPSIYEKIVSFRLI